MDLQTVLDVVSIGLSILAIILSITVLIDNRRKTTIMNQQLGILQEQDESKKEIRNAMRTVSKIQEMISNTYQNYGNRIWIQNLLRIHNLLTRFVSISVPP